MLFVLIFLHVIICVALIFVVLLQTGKGGLDSNFGGIAANALGAQGASDFLKKWTKILFVAFILSCVLIGIQVRGGTGEGFMTGSRSNRITERAQREMQNQPVADEMPFEMQLGEPIEVQMGEPVEVQMGEPIQIQMGEPIEIQLDTPTEGQSQPIIIEL